MITTTRIDLPLNDYHSLVEAWNDYKEYNNWIRANLVLHWPSYERGELSLPLYFNFKNEEDAMAFKLKFDIRSAPSTNSDVIV